MTHGPARVSDRDRAAGSDGDPPSVSDRDAASTTNRDSARVGIAGPHDHPVFSTVAERLRDRGHEVTWFDPTEPIGTETLRGLSLFLAKRNRPASVRALAAAERLGVATWNSATSAMVCVHHVTQLCALAGVGFTVPPVTVDPPSGDYVAKDRFHWGGSPRVNGEGDVYEPLLDAAPTDFKYYAVDDGEGVAVTVVRATSKLHGEKRVLGTAEAKPGHVARIEHLMDRLEVRGVGVDLVRVGDDWYAVDLNPCPSYAGAGMTDALVRSIESALPRRSA